MRFFPGWTRWALALSLLVFASSRVRLPLPTALLDDLVAEHAPGFRLEYGEQWLRWGDGRLVVEDLVVRWQEQPVLRVDRAELVFELWPGDADFLLPRRVDVEHAELRADPESVEAVRELVQRLIPPDRPRRGPPAMAFRVTDLSADALDADGERWSLEGVDAEGHLDPGAGARARLEGELLHPWPGRVALHAEGGPDFLRWRAALDADLETRPGLDLLQDGDWDWQGGPLRVAATATVDSAGLQDLRARVDAYAARFAGRTRPLEARDLRLRLEGDARRGFVLEATGVETHGAVSVRAEARAPREAAQAAGAIPLTREALAAWRLHVVADAPDVVADDEAVAWLARVDPTLPPVTAAIDSLGARGRASLQTGLGYRPAGGWHWALAVVPREVTMNYRGFVEPNGRRVAVPYPVDVDTGMVLAGGRSVLWDATARAGFARVASRGTLDFRPQDWTDLDIALQVDGLALDRQAAHALSGNPDLATYWREAGSPLGGTLDLQVRLRDGAQDFRWSVGGRVRGATGAPLLLPVQTRIEDATFTAREGIAEFRGRLSALGSTLQANGALRARADDGWALSLEASGTGFRPSAGERLALQHYLRFPEELADVDVYGDLRYGLSLRMPDVRAQPHVLVSLDLAGATASQRVLELDFTDLQGGGTLVSGRGGLGVFLPELRMGVPGGEARGSVVVHPMAALRVGTLDTSQVELDEELTARLRQLVGLDLFEDEVGLGGTVRLRASADPMRPETFRGVLHCEPVRISAADAERGRENFTVEGDVLLAPNRVRAPRLHLTGKDTDLWVRGFDLRRDEAGKVVLSARLDSATGLRMSSNLPLLLGADALAALRAIGLDGRARPQDLEVRLTGRGESLQLTMTGEVAVDRLAVDTGPGEGLREGSTLLRIDEAVFRRSDGFRGRVQVGDAQGTWSGMRFQGGTGTLLIDPAALRLVGFQAEMLGGQVVSDYVGADGEAVAGELSLGLTVEGPLHARLAGRGLVLDRMREELRTGGSLSGTLDAEIDMYGSAARSTALSGGGTVTVRDGVLGTVPVLKDIWAFAGVRPPVFSSGRVVFDANGEDRVAIRELSLQHELLEVQGDGYIRFDTELHLKVTLRTLGPFGRLPVLRDILDWFIEQDVRGPIERPVIYQRSTSKLFNTEPFVPFPLWLPPAPRPDWRTSPGIPVTPADAPRP